MPARNAGRTIAQALNSLLAQTDVDWEALVVDDRSTDETADIVKSYTQRDTRFVSLVGEGAGAAAARNVAIARSSGRRVLFLDSDDWIDDRFLELMNAALDAAPGSVAAYCGDRRVMPDGRLGPVRSDPQIACAPFEAFARSCAAAIHAVLIEREALMRIGNFDARLRTCEDWDLWQRAARLGGRWVHVDVPLSYYRASGHSLTQDVDQMLADAAIVVRRGFSADERLSGINCAHPHGASNADGRTADIAYAYFALWCAALDCARGGTGHASLEHLGHLEPSADLASVIVGVLLQGTIVGQRVVPADLAARWPAFGSRLTGLITALGKAWDDPLAARRIQYQFERLLLDYDDLIEPRPLALTLGIRVDLRDLATITPPPGVDRLYAYLCDGAQVLALLDLGALGIMTTRGWLELAASLLDGSKSVARNAAPAIIRSLTWRKLGQGLREAGGALSSTAHHGWRRALSRAARQAVFGAAGPLHAARSHEEALHRLLVQAEQPAAVSHSVPAKPVVRARDGSGNERYGTRRDYWEDLFERPDPWNYTSAYEQEKYDRQLALLPQGSIGRALELACAEGHFTEKLARRVERLIASDISTIALARAEHRCRTQGNIEFRQLDLAVDPLPENLDLIVVSEVLYFLKDEAELEQVARRFVSALKPGGCIVTAHAFVLNEDLLRTGFDWAQRWGARTIARVLSTASGLALQRSIRTELYRIDRYVRLGDSHQRDKPVVKTLPINAQIEMDVARHIVWGGAVARRADLAATERHQQMPVLMYHRIADDGPASLARYRVSAHMFRTQMRWLRRNGYHSIVSEELAWFLAHRHPFVGRPVMLSFDDGYQDFADQAWPILRLHDFRAEVFVVTDSVGQAAEWDSRFGEPAPLMDAATIACLASEGVSFGSHLATHRCADGLSTRELAEELTRSRSMLRRWAAPTSASFSAPYSRTDERLRVLAAQCGYRVGFGGEARPASLACDPLNVPRIEVQGDWTLDTFVSAVEACR
jgi:peptidoglycan/xylan/chitin deacetylase (PgdA/CDA1 family)/ubiquinone/menaquinone biosynthesis C-methylase UbiE